MSEYFSMREPIDVDGAVERTVVNIGEILRRQRLAKGLKLDDIARELRIDVRQLEALENNQYAIFSGSVFIRGYLRNYARMVDLDPEPLVKAFNLDTDIKTPEITPIKRVMRSTRDQSRSLHYLLLLKPYALIAAVAALLWVGGEGVYRYYQEGEVSGKGVESTAKPGVTTEEPLDITSRITPPPPASNGGGAESLPLPASVATLGAPTKPLETAAGSSVAIINPPKIAESRVTPPTLPSTTPPAVAGSVNAQKPNSTVPASTESSAGDSAGKTSIKLRFTEDSWVDIRDATELRLTAKIGRAGTETTLQGVPPLRVVLGNSSAVAIEYEGKAIEVPKARRNQVVRFEVGKKSAE